MGTLGDGNPASPTARTNSPTLSGPLMRPARHRRDRHPRKTESRLAISSRSSDQHPTQEGPQQVQGFRCRFASALQ
jgi:hypothetical protein